ncbi:MAG: Type IV pilus assembly PilZ [uncultured bacterium]|nr:MAG: Type IV pilus assembly PilZ [uncultured bacterium]
MTADIETLKSIPNGKPVRIFLPFLNSPDRIRAQCVYQQASPPKFTLIFKSGMIPVDEIDIRQPCIVTIDMGGPTLSLEAMIQAIVDPFTLQMIVQKSISHEQMREFFRIDAVTRVISKSFHTQFGSNTSEPWSLQGETIDISGSGILAVFADLPPADKQVHLEIFVPLPEPETVKVIAHPVRTHRLNDNRCEVAYHFDDISMEDRDKIIGCCLVIQRRLLRLKVQVKNNRPQGS